MLILQPLVNWWGMWGTGIPMKNLTNVLSAITKVLNWASWKGIWGEFCTVWKMQNSYDIQILCEIKFGECRVLKSDNSSELGALNYDIHEFLHILKTEIYPINKLQSPNNWKNGKFRNFKFSKNWFHVILCDRKILKFPHRRETLSYFPVKSSTSTYIYSRIFFPSNQAAVEITQFLFTKITWKHFFLLFFQMSYWRTSLPMFTLYVRKSRHFQTKASFTHPYWWKTVWVRHLSCPIHSI